MVGLVMVVVVVVVAVKCASRCWCALGADWRCESWLCWLVGWLSCCGSGGDVVVGAGVLVLVAGVLTVCINGVVVAGGRFSAVNLT